MPSESGEKMVNGKNCIVVRKSTNVVLSTLKKLKKDYGETFLKWKFQGWPITGRCPVIGHFEYLVKKVHETVKFSEKLIDY